jgi:hypothetical protein
MDDMATPESTSTHPTLLSAAARFDQLSMRDALAAMAEEEEPGTSAPLTIEEALELLALGEVITRKAAYGRQLTVRSARVAGASWSQIGAALAISKQAAWEAHSQWIDDQAEQNRRDGISGMDGDMADAARTLAGPGGTDADERVQPDCTRVRRPQTSDLRASRASTNDRIRGGADDLPELHPHGADRLAVNIRAGRCCRSKTGGGAA